MGLPRCPLPRLIRRISDAVSYIPGRVAKQIVAMFGTLNGSGFFQRHPELQKYVLNKNEVGLPEKFRLYCFLTSKTHTPSELAELSQ